MALLVDDVVTRTRPAPSGFPALVKRLGEPIALRLGVGLSRLCGAVAGGGVGILTYHRVATPVRGVPAPTWNVSPARFRQQMKTLLAAGYRPWPLRRLLDYQRTGRAVPRKTFVVTFDDGFAGVYHAAWPVLSQCAVPATIFLATAYLDSDRPFPFDYWAAARSSAVPAESWLPLSTAQCAEMRAGGLIELGSHTHSHAVFRGRPDALYEDLRASLEVLRERFSQEDATFAFPFGIADRALSAAVRRAGMICGLTSNKVPVRPQSDPFTWGRFNVDESDTAATLAAKLDGWFSLARSVWLRLRRAPPQCSSASSAVRWDGAAREDAL